MFGVIGCRSKCGPALAEQLPLRLSIILAQFTCKGFSDGMEGVVRVVEAAPKLQVSLHHRIEHTEFTFKSTTRKLRSICA